MIDKNRIFDVELVAFAQYKGIACSHSNSGSYRIHADDVQFSNLYQEYRDYRLECEQIRKRIARLRTTRSLHPTLQPSL